MLAYCKEKGLKSEYEKCLLIAPLETLKSFIA
nr:MAG TPA: hypothetical protein [Caudoviricetes sp.]